MRRCYMVKKRLPLAGASFLGGVLSEPKGDEAILEGPFLPSRGRLLPPMNRGRNDILVRELAPVTDEVEHPDRGPHGSGAAWQG